MKSNGLSPKLSLSNLRGVAHPEHGLNGFNRSPCGILSVELITEPAGVPGLITAQQFASIPENEVTVGHGNDSSIAESWKPEQALTDIETPEPNRNVQYIAAAAIIIVLLLAPDLLK